MIWDTTTLVIVNVHSNTDPLHLVLTDALQLSGGYNGGKTMTPAIDGLVAEGVRLTEFYTFRVCSPSRASSMTGTLSSSFRNPTMKVSLG